MTTEAWILLGSIPVVMVVIGLLMGKFHGL